MENKVIIQTTSNPDAGTVETSVLLNGAVFCLLEEQSMYEDLLVSFAEQLGCTVEYKDIVIE